MINLKGVVKKLNLSRFIIHEKLMCVGIRLIISVTFLLLVVSVRLQAQDTKVSHPFMWKSFNNPAYSGFDGLAGVNIGMQRSYWSKPLDFRSYFVSADYAFQEKRRSLSVLSTRSGKFGDVCDPAVCCRLVGPGETVTFYGVAGRSAT